MITQKMINDAMDGDQSALTDLYNSTYGAVYNTVRFMIKDEDSVLDIMQDTYIKAFESLGQLEDASRFEPWVKRIAQNKAIDYLRKVKPLAFSEMLPDDSEVLEFKDERVENLPEAVIDRSETARMINEILDSLPDDQRACIFYYDQLSVKEISSELGIPEATVKSRLQYGRKKIEAKVRDLEKKGTKLYGIAPLPFFLLLFRQAGQDAQAPSASVLEGILSGISEGAGTSGTAGIIGGARTAGVAVGLAGKSLAIKIIAAVAAIAVISGGIAVVNHSKQEAPVPVPVIEPQTPEATNEVASEDRQTTENIIDNTDPGEDEKEPSGEGEKQTESEEEFISDEACAKAYQDILEQYRICMSQGPTGNSPLLNIEKVRKTTETRDGSRAIRYALYDIDHNGVKELIMIYCEFDLSGNEIKNKYKPFDLYTFDGNEAVCIFQDINLDYINLHIGDNGICWAAFLDENGNERTDYYQFFGVIRKGSDGRMKFVDSEYFSLDRESGGKYYDHYVAPGESTESLKSDSVPVQEFRDIWLPKDVELKDYSILKNVYNSD